MNKRSGGLKISFFKIVINCLAQNLGFTQKFLTSYSGLAKLSSKIIGSRSRSRTFGLKGKLGVFEGVPQGVSVGVIFS